MDPARFDPSVTAGEAVLTAAGATVGLGVVVVASFAFVVASFHGSGPNFSSSLPTVLITVGGALATPAGAHLANRSRGDYATGVLATTLAMVVAGGAAGLIGSQMDGPPPVFLVIIPVSMIGAAAVAEVAPTP